MFSQVFIRSTTCRLNSTVCRRHFAILAILPPFAAKVRLFGVSQFWGSLHNGFVPNLRSSAFIGGESFFRGRLVIASKYNTVFSGIQYLIAYNLVYFLLN